MYDQCVVNLKPDGSDSKIQNRINTYTKLTKRVNTPQI